MLSTLQHDAHQRRLGLAFDLPVGPYLLGGLALRPYSINAHRRAEILGLVIVAEGMDAARARLTPSQWMREIDALHWILAAPLDEVQRTYRAGVAAVWARLQHSTLASADLLPFVAEIEQSLDLARAALFDVVERDTAASAVSDETPPPGMIAPPMLASLVLGLSEGLGASEAYVLEDLPFARAVQYLHVLQHRNPLIWTVSPHSVAPDPYGAELPADEGYGETIDF